VDEREFEGGEVVIVTDPLMEVIFKHDGGVLTRALFFFFIFKRQPRMIFNPSYRRDLGWISQTIFKEELA
jgi:hypothetical protein